MVEKAILLCKIDIHRFLDIRHTDLECQTFSYNSNIYGIKRSIRCNRLEMATGGETSLVMETPPREQRGNIMITCYFTLHDHIFKS